MPLPTILESLRDGVGPTRVFAEPVERRGVTVIAAANVIGGGGGGFDDSGGKADGEPSLGGGGGGFGVLARPAGFIEISDAGAEWKPAPVDLTLVLIAASVFAVPAAVRAIARGRRSR